MSTTTTEVADGIFRISTFVPDAGMSFNQILVRADEPLLFHTGMRALFPAVAEAVEAVLAVSSLRWIGFGHVEADECGAMNQWLEAAPHAAVRVRVHAGAPPPPGSPSCGGPRRCRSAW